MSVTEENPKDDQMINSNTTTDNMDLLNVTFRSLNLGEMMKRQEDLFRIDEGSNAVSQERMDLSKERRRILDETSGELRSLENAQSGDLRWINLNEVAWHDTADNCWLIIYDYVYDCTEFLDTHPGGSDVLLEYAGRDATLAFIGTGHSTAARQSLERYLVGELPPEERIFRVSNGVKVSWL